MNHKPDLGAHTFPFFNGTQNGAPDVVIKIGKATHPQSQVLCKLAQPVFFFFLLKTQGMWLCLAQHGQSSWPPNLHFNSLWDGMGMGWDGMEWNGME